MHTLTEAEQAQYEHASYTVPRCPDGIALWSIQDILKELWEHGQLIDPTYLLLSSEDFTAIKRQIGDVAHIRAPQAMAAARLHQAESHVYLLNQSNASHIELIQEDLLPHDTMVFLYRKEEWQEVRTQQEEICNELWREMGLSQMFADMQQEWRRREDVSRR